MTLEPAGGGPEKAAPAVPPSVVAADPPVADSPVGDRFADLHVHSDHSDGNFAAVYLPELAARHGVAALALTDHDTVAGLKSCAKGCQQEGVEFVPGIELSCSLEGTEVHVLGYYINPSSSGLRELTSEIAGHRQAMIAELCRRLAEAGWPLDPEDYTRPNRGFVERVHLARAVKRKYGLQDEQLTAAVNPYSHDLGAHFTTDVADAVRAVRVAGGAAVLAHPWVYRDAAGNDLLPMVLERCLPAGLGGLEINEVKCGRDKADELRRLAIAHGLVVTTGSDFHGLPAGSWCGQRPWTKHRFPYAQVASLRALLEKP